MLGSSWSFMTVSEERKGIVIEDIHQGSVPGPLFYIMLSLSALIAAFGLLQNSPAIVIGAMLISPLMIPIFGIAVAVSRGDTALLRRALLAEFGGVALSILVTLLVGLLPTSLEVTSEMLARTRPTLVDLLIAALAGLAAALALIDKRVSPALPGVAMATSLTPPLATCGLALAFGMYEGAWGAFLLFFANFLAILSVTAVIFIISGFVTWTEIGSRTDLAKRFTATAVGLLAVTVLLSFQLVAVIRDWRTEQEIGVVIASELANRPGTAVIDMVYDRKPTYLDVFATIQTPRVLTPQKVKLVEDALATSLGEDVRLYVRCSITTDVTALGGTTLQAQRSLDGEFAVAEYTPDVDILHAAEQVIRERLAYNPDVFVESVELLNLTSGPLITVAIRTSRAPLAFEVEEVERAIEERLGGGIDVRLLGRSLTLVDVSSKGRVLLGQAHFGDTTIGERETQALVEKTVTAEFEGLRDLFVANIDAYQEPEGWVVRAEVVGPRVPTPKEVTSIEKKVGKITELPVDLTVWARVEVVVTDGRYDSVINVTRQAAIDR